MAAALPPALAISATTSSAGLARPLAPELAKPFARLAAAAAYRIAVDLPSGVASDDGALLSPVPDFELTLALGALKPAHLLQPGAARCGAVRLIDLGIRASSETRLLGPVPRPVPGPLDHKYRRGMVAIVAGAMPGAAQLAGEAALRSGAGYVLLLGAEGGQQAIVARDYAPEALLNPRIGALLLGPGLGRDASAHERLAAALAVPRPLVLDGDALHLVRPAALSRRRVPLVLTPHEGEFVAMFGVVPGSKVVRARAAAAGSGAVVVLKGADTVIAAPDGRAVIAPPGSPWLATAGTGDVLAGAIAAALASGTGAFEAAQAGVWRHGAAAWALGPGFIADDLAHQLGEEA